MLRCLTTKRELVDAQKPTLKRQSSQVSAPADLGKAPEVRRSAGRMVDIHEADYLHRSFYASSVTD